MNIIEKLLTINPFSRPSKRLSSVKYIVIHWVGNANTSALANRNYFENLKSGKVSYYDNNGNPVYIYASSHYIIGLDGEIIRCIPENEVAYHAGNYNVNCNSIGIENCHPDWGGKFNDNTYNALVELCVDICKRYGLNQNAIIRHYDVTGKKCPLYYVNNVEAFNQFKNDVAARLGNATQTITNEPASSSLKYKVGDVVTINGVYRSSNSLTKLNPAVKTGTITKVIASAKNPYLLNNGNIGWANDSCINSMGVNTSSEETTTTAVNIAKGSRVVLSTNATRYATGQAIPNVYKGKAYTIMQVGNGKVLLQELYSWVYTKDLLGVRTNSSSSSTSSTGKKLYLPASATSWRIYPTNKQPVKGNECGYLKPSKFGGLTYDILATPQKDVVTIQTRDYGKVNIYVASSTGAVIK